MSFQNKKLLIILLFLVNSSFIKNTINLPQLEYLTNYSVSEFHIEFNSIDLVYNDHVGNEWFYYIKVNGTKLYLKDEIKVSITYGQSIAISCILQEMNEKYNDHALVSFELSNKDLIKYKNNGFYVPVIITESNGRFAGNKAQMNFYINIY